MGLTDYNIDRTENSILTKLFNVAELYDQDILDLDQSIEAATKIFKQHEKKKTDTIVK